MKNYLFLYQTILICLIISINFSCSNDNILGNPSEINLQDGDVYIAYKEPQYNGWGFKDGEENRTGIIRSGNSEMKLVDVFPFEHSRSHALIKVNNVYLQKDPESNDIRIIDKSLENIINSLDIPDAKVIQEIDNNKVAITNNENLFIANTETWEYEIFDITFAASRISQFQQIGNSLLCQLGGLYTSQIVRLDLETKEVITSDLNLGRILYNLDGKLLVSNSFVFEFDLLELDPITLEILDTIEITDNQGGINRAKIIRIDDMLYLHNENELFLANKDDLIFSKIELPAGNIQGFHYSELQERFIFSIREEIDFNDYIYHVYFMDKSHEITKNVEIDYYPYLFEIYG